MLFSLYDSCKFYTVRKLIDRFFSFFFKPIRWFRSFKYEEAYLTQYNNIREARKAIGKYVHTYNFERCHSALNIF
ncbi:MAG: integrase core domain-containing protein [Coprococcus sp.]